MSRTYEKEDWQQHVFRLRAHELFLIFFLFKFFNVNNNLTNTKIIKLCIFSLSGVSLIILLRSLSLCQANSSSSIFKLLINLLLLLLKTNLLFLYEQFAFTCQCNWGHKQNPFFFFLDEFCKIFLKDFGNFTLRHVYKRILGVNIALICVWSELEFSRAQDSKIHTPKEKLLRAKRKLQIEEH